MQRKKINERPIRLAHRLLSFPVEQMIPWNISGRCVNEQMFKTLWFYQQILRHRAQIVVADNVATWLAEHEQTEWDIATDFHCVRAPFDTMFIEWNTPPRTLISSGWVDQIKAQFGVLIMSPKNKRECEVSYTSFSASATGDPQYERMLAAHEAAHGILWCEFFMQFDGRPLYTGVRVYIYLREDGHPFESILIPFNAACASTEWLAHMQQPLLTLCFMHCKNVSITDATTSEGPTEKWLRRTKSPALTYRVLNIDPMKQAMRSEGDIENNGFKKALHICRGHFATYTNEHPLFGKFTGTFWKPQHVRGSASEGVVVKDYRVGVPE